jgi:antitoxin (DNA-binding transcriptional repressor) of toxin-antitoxin stability system
MAEKGCREKIEGLQVLVWASSNGVDCTEFCQAAFEKPAMGFSARDVVPFTQTRVNLSELVDPAKAGAEKLTTKKGESHVALTDADRLDDHHRFARERIHLLLMDDAKRGLADITAGRTCEADPAIAQLQQRRAGATTSSARRHATGTTGKAAEKRG